MTTNDKTLYIFLDESGNFDFSKNGTKHFVIAAYSTTEPQQHTLSLQELKYEILHTGYDQECFHATEDGQVVRDNVYEIIKRSKNAMYDFAYIEKNKTHPFKQNKKEIYTLLVGILLKYIFTRVTKKNTFKNIIVVVDQALPKKDQNYLKAIIKPQLKAFGKPYFLYFFQTKSDPNGQIADYGAWGKYVLLERNELRPIGEIKKLIASDFDVFRMGTRRYY